MPGQRVGKDMLERGVGREHLRNKPLMVRGRDGVGKELWYKPQMPRGRRVGKDNNEVVGVGLKNDIHLAVAVCLTARGRPFLAGTPIATEIRSHYIEGRTRILVNQPGAYRAIDFSQNLIKRIASSDDGW